MYTVYCHLFPNGKRYVGITKLSVERRWGNGAKYKTCPLIYKAIQKYGWDNVRHEILDRTDTLEEAIALEQHYISLYNTQDPMQGYNILPGGDVSNNHSTEEMRHKLGNGWRGKHRSAEEKQRISDGVRKAFRSRAESNGHFGMRHTDATRKKMSDAQKKKWREDPTIRERASLKMKERMADPEYKRRILDNLAAHPPGKRVVSDETKAKISKAFKGRWLGEKSPLSKPVLQFTKDGQFVKRWSNAGAAERAGVGSRSSIRKCCVGAPHVKSVGGYVWKYEEDVLNEAAIQRPF